MRNPMRTLLVVTSLVLALGASAAQAHAFLDHATPLVGSTVASAPHEVVLTFTQNLEPAMLIGLVSMLALIAIVLNEGVRRAELYYERWRA